LAQADLDGNGQLDVVTANYSSSTVSVLRNSGDGSFQPAVHYTTGSNAIAVAVGDLNGDGRPDLVTANYGAHTVSVLLQNADGTFATKVDYSVGSRPRGVILADLNGDGHPDVVTANENGNSVSVLLGDGTGALGARVDYAAGAGATRVAVADLDGDDHLDLVTADTSAHTISVLRGNGDGTFQTPVAYSTGANTQPRDVVLVDLDGDGHLDAATANRYGLVSLLRGNGDGTFVPAAAALFGSADNQAYQIAVSDLNGDGQPDLAVAAYNSNRLYVTLNQGGEFGSFEPVSGYTPSGNPIGVVAGDFNGDGRLDLVTANYSNHTVSVLTGHAQKSLSEDPAGSGVYSAFGRGNLWSTSDYDYFSFTARSGTDTYLVGGDPG
jgi:hypothetical protein